LALPPDAALTFLSLDADTDNAPEAIAIVKGDENPTALTRLAERRLVFPLRVKVLDALEGFVVWPRDDWKTLTAKSNADSELKLAGAEVILRQRMTTKGGDNEPPRFDASVLVRRDGLKEELLGEEKDRPLSRYSARVFASKDVFVVELHVSTAEEGSYGSWLKVWRCASGSTCNEASSN